MKPPRRKQHPMFSSRIVAGLGILSVALLHLHLGLLHTGSTPVAGSAMAEAISSAGHSPADHGREWHHAHDEEPGQNSPSHSDLHEHDNGALYARERVPGPPTTFSAFRPVTDRQAPDRRAQRAGVLAPPLRSPGTAFFLLHLALLY